MQFDVQQLGWQTWIALGLGACAVAWMVWRAGFRKAAPPGTLPSPQPRPSSDSQTRRRSSADNTREADVAVGMIDRGPQQEVREEFANSDVTAVEARKSWSAHQSLPDVLTDSGVDVLKSAASPLVRCEILMARIQSQLTSFSPAEAASAFREIVMLATDAGLPEQHAAARIELGELARLDGDLITACEHWQIARGLFHDLNNKPRSKAVEARMREHGCPTDWVLNDF